MQSAKTSCQQTFFNSLDNNVLMSLVQLNIPWVMSVVSLRSVNDGSIKIGTRRNGGKDYVHNIYFLV